MVISKILRSSAYIAVSGSVTLVTPALAQDTLLQLSPASDWQISAKPDRCRLSRRFGDQDSPTTLIAEKGGNESIFNLTLVGQPVANPIGPLVSLQFGPSEKAFGRPYISVKARSGRAAMVMYGADFSPAVLSDNGQITTDTVDEDRLAKIEYLQIERAGLTPFQLKTGSLVEPMAELAECAAKLSEALTAATRTQIRPPKPLTSPGSWILPKDYPSKMLSFRQDGEVSFRLTVDAQGKPTFCNIDKSNVPQMFDNAVCLSLMKNAEFEPALDVNGGPVLSYYIQSARFITR